jgi:catechol 2,3-dioxygenase-like lactoylglutathione lyase family enzyme
VLTTDRGTRLVEGIHHITFLTEDIERLSAFYERVLGARKTLDMTEEGMRHVFLEVGPTTVLHLFQLLDEPPLPEAPGTMFQRGRTDHFASWLRRRRRFGRSAAVSRRRASPTETSAT